MRCVTRLLMIVALLTAFALPMGLIHGGSGNAAALSDISIQLDVPSFAGKSQKVACTLMISGGPAGAFGGNYSYRAEIVADNRTGSSVFPSSGTSSTGVFKINITMPGEAFQKIKVKINATSEEEVITGGESVYKVKEFEVEIVDPIIIEATVYNVGAVDAEGVEAKFYADETLLGSMTFAVPADSSKIITYNWTWASVPNGEHVVKVVIDDPNSIVEFSDGNNVYSMTVYIGSVGNPVGAVLSVGVIIMSVFVMLTFLQKPQKRKK